MEISTRPLAQASVKMSWASANCIFFAALCSSRKTPHAPHGRSLEIPRGRGLLKAKFLEAMYENKLEFPGGGGDVKQKPFRGGSVDIFWNCTFLKVTHPMESALKIKFPTLQMSVDGKIFIRFQNYLGKRGQGLKSQHKALFFYIA